MKQNDFCAIESGPSGKCFRNNIKLSTSSGARLICKKEGNIYLRCCHFLPHHRIVGFNKPNKEYFFYIYEQLFFTGRCTNSISCKHDEYCEMKNGTTVGKCIRRNLNRR